MENIIIHSGILEELSSFCPEGRKYFVVTDSGVPHGIIENVTSRIDISGIFTVAQGEASKSLESVSSIVSELAGHRFSRKDCVIAVGGGMVLDLAGFVSSIYMRGISTIYVPTTLLAMVDASIGGKTAVDFGGVKNLVGSFHNPVTVVIDTDTLKTLPRRLLSEGMAEVIKIAATLDGEFFTYLENDSCDINYIVRHSVELKRDVVLKDPLEEGYRRVLNFGHTIGHAIEAAGKGKFLHGEAVAMGMKPMCSKIAWERIRPLLMKYGLPFESPYTLDELREYFAMDKKSDGEGINTVFVDEIGSFEIRKWTV